MLTKRKTLVIKRYKQAESDGMEEDSNHNQIKLEDMYEYLAKQTLRFKKSYYRQRKTFYNDKEVKLIGRYSSWIYIYIHMGTQPQICEANADRIKDIHNSCSVAADFNIRLLVMYNQLRRRSIKKQKT